MGPETQKVLEKYYNNYYNAKPVEKYSYVVRVFNPRKEYEDRYEEDELFHKYFITEEEGIEYIEKVTPLLVELLKLNLLKLKRRISKSYELYPLDHRIFTPASKCAPNYNPEMDEEDIFIGDAVILFMNDKCDKMFIEIELYKLNKIVTRRQVDSENLGIC